MPSITKTGDRITFRNNDAIYQVATSGHSVYLAALNNNQIVWESNQSSGFAIIHLDSSKGPLTLSSSGLDYAPINNSPQEGTLTVPIPSRHQNVYSLQGRVRSFSV